MRTYQFVLLTLLIYSAGAMAKMEAHEWGTFTSLVGSNGVTQNGMYHEDEALPRFVHGFGETLPEAKPIGTAAFMISDPGTPPTRPPCYHTKGCFDMETLSKNVITQKMETPVIYFYADHAQHVNVNVAFPEGVITETFPAPVQSSPQANAKDLVLSHGQARFSVNVLDTKTAILPTVEKANIYSHARNVNSNVVQSGSEVEKFIFYRGLGRFQPSFSLTSRNGDLHFLASASSLPVAAFLVHVNAQGQSQMLPLPDLKAAQEKIIPAVTVQALENHNVVSGIFVSGAAVKTQLAQALVQAGLYTDEAQAMLNTWENGYLKVPGLRLLYILPRSEVDHVLPLNFSPALDNFHRVFVGRIEVLTDVEENDLLQDILQQQGHFDVASLGRFAEPMLRRVLQVYETHPRKETQVADEKLLNALIEQSFDAAFTSKSSLQ